MLEFLLFNAIISESDKFKVSFTVSLGVTVKLPMLSYLGLFNPTLRSISCRFFELILNCRNKYYSILHKGNHINGIYLIPFSDL